MKPDPDGVQLLAVPLFHITALWAVSLNSIPQGSKVVMMRKWEASAGLRLIEKEKVTRVTGVPTMMMDMMEHPDWSPQKVKTLRGIAAGGAPVPPSQVSQMRKKAKKIESAQGYGLTETMGLGTVNTGVDYLRRPTSCGRPAPLVIEVAIIDPETKKKVPDGQRGEVCLRQRNTHCARLRRCRVARRDPRQEFDQRNRFVAHHAPGGAVAVMDRARHRALRRGKMVEQAEKEGQVGGLDPPFVHRQDEAPARGFDQPVGVRDPFGDALGRDEFADIVMRDESRKFLGPEMGIDGHASRSAGAAV